MIGFVVAMEKEARLFLDTAKIEKTEVYACKKIFVGKYLDREFVLIISGVGKVNAGMSTQILIDRYNVDTIINFGVAGGKRNSGLTAGDVVLISEVCQYDCDLSEIDDVNVGYMQDYALTYFPTAYQKYKGNAFEIRKGASGDRFTKDIRWLQIISDIGGEVVDMESGAIAQVSYSNNIPLYIIKLISDVDGADESIFEQYSNNVCAICDKIPNAIKELFKALQ